MTPLDAAQVRAWLRAAGTGALATTATAERVRGFPFATAVPLVWHNGAAIMYVADIAEHGRNLAADSRCSLLIAERGLADPTLGWRITLVGEATALAGTASSDALDAFCAHHPQTQRLPGFVVRALRPQHARVIVGFGHMGWLRGDAL